MHHYRLYRLAVAILVIALISIGVFDYYDILKEKVADIGFGITAGLLAVVAAFAIRPPGEEIADIIPEAMAKLPEDVLLTLRERSIHSQELKEYIEVTSNEIFLRKMETALYKAIENRYTNSELERLMLELDGVERELRRASLPILTKEMPERLRRTISEIKSVEDRSNLLNTILSEFGYSPATRSIIVATTQMAGRVISLVMPFRF